jgi:hypothetical protein
MIFKTQLKITTQTNCFLNIIQMGEMVRIKYYKNMPRQDDRAARVLARTREVNESELEGGDDENRVRDSVNEKKSARSKRSERIVINNQEMDIDKVVQKVRERLSSPSITSPKPPSSSIKPEKPSPRVLIERVSIKDTNYVEQPSPRSPDIKTRMPVGEVRELYTREEILPERPDTRVSPAFSYETLRKSTREDVVDSLKNLNSHQLREEILKLRSERSTQRNSKPRSIIPSARNDDKIPVYDQESGTWVLYPRHKLPVYQTPPSEVAPRINPPLIRRGTTRDAYPTKTRTMDFEGTYQHDYHQGPPTVVAVNQQEVEESTDIDFDSMTDVQRREFIDEMKMKFAVLKKNYPDFPIPVIHDDDNPKWVFGIYEQLLDMAKGDASQPIYQTGLQVVFLVLQVVLSVSGIPAKDFFSFHSRHFSQYNKLMVELGEKWGPIIDITSSTETKLALAIGWNTVVFAVVSVVASKFGDKWGTSVEKLLDKFTTATSAASSQKMEDLKRQMDGREEVKPEPEATAQGGAPDMMGGIANLLGGLLGGGGNGGGGGGLGNLLGGLLGGAAGMNNGSATSTERKPPTYDD